MLPMGPAGGSGHRAAGLGVQAAAFIHKQRMGSRPWLHRLATCATEGWHKPLAAAMPPPPAVPMCMAALPSHAMRQSSQRPPAVEGGGWQVSHLAIGDPPASAADSQLSIPMGGANEGLHPTPVHPDLPGPSLWPQMLLLVRTCSGHRSSEEPAPQGWPVPPGWHPGRAPLALGRPGRRVSSPLGAGTLLTLEAKEGC